MRRVIVLTALAALAAGASIAASSVSSAAVKSVNVQVFAFPSSKAYPHVHGAKVPMTLVASTATTGRTFSVSLSGLPNRTTNLVAIGLSGGSIVDESFFSVSRAGIYVGTFPDIAHVSTTVVDRSLAHPNAPNVLVCTTYFDRGLGNLPGVVGGVFSTTNGGTESFSYKLGASSAIGVGTSATGKAGTFSAGARTLSRTKPSLTPVLTCSVPAVNSRYYSLRANTTLSAFKRSPVLKPTPTSPKTEDVYGGWTPVKVGKITVKQCASYAGPYTLTKTSTKAWDFKAGLSIPAINFNASTETGYTTTASVSYHLNSGVTRKICGVSSGPGGKTRNSCRLNLSANPPHRRCWRCSRGYRCRSLGSFPERRPGRRG